VIQWCRTNYYKLRFSFSSAKFLVDYYKRASILLNRQCIFQFLQILIKTSSHHCLKNFPNVFQFLQDNLTSNSINQNLKYFKLTNYIYNFIISRWWSFKISYDTCKEKEGELLTLVTLLPKERKLYLGHLIFQLVSSIFNQSINLQNNNIKMTSKQQLDNNL
jgi:hypothetical protein